MPRSSAVENLLGTSLFNKVQQTPILVVGAGGIGCELLKNLVLVGFGNIEIIDLDTIDLSNLNRQFLFRKADIKKPKALVASASAHHFNPSSGISINARYGNVKDTENDYDWIKGFGLVMNALDNLDARRHVNRLCQAAGVLLIESGTAGYTGQVQVMIKDQSECFDCEPKKPANKSFPVCTIRATPSEPIHCIVWAKSYLLPKLYGEDDEAGDTEELDKAQNEGENAEEIENLKREAAAFREVRRSLAQEGGPRQVFHRVFNEDINRLLSMEDMWKAEGRVKPVPLVHDAIMEDTFVVPPLRKTNNQPNGMAAEQANGATKESEKGQTNGTLVGQDSGRLRDQKVLTLKDNLELFLDSCRRLTSRLSGHPELVLAFDKDDRDTLDFVVATANLRATAYGIPNRTTFQVKEMAGQIIPAIATTNAVVAGLIVMRAVNLLAGSLGAAKNVYVRADAQRPVARYALAPPQESCPVCRDIYIPLKANTSSVTLGSFVLDIVGKWLLPALAGPTNGSASGNVREGDALAFECSVMEGGRVLCDPDFDDNHERTLADLGIGRGKILTVMDEDDKYRPIHFCVCELDSAAQAPYTLPDQPASLPLRPRQPRQRSASSSPGLEILPGPPAAVVTEAATTAPAAKRAAPDDDDGSDDATGPKKRRLANGGRSETKTNPIDSDDEDYFEMI